MPVHSHQLPLHPLSGILCTASDSYDSILYPHYHGEGELSLILSGVHSVETENERMELAAGGLILLRPDEIHSRRMLEPGRYLTLAFPARELERLAEYLDDDGFRAAMRAKRPPCAQLHAAEAESLARSMERVNLFCMVDATRARTELRGLLADCWCRHFIGLDGENPQRVPWLSRMLAEMTRPENIRRGLDAMLELSPYSHEYLCREFRRLMGCTPTEYVNSLRLDRAHTLLESTRLDVAGICCEVGFDSVSYFYQLFRGKYGVPPARYRKLRFASRPGVPQEQREE